VLVLTLLSEEFGFDAYQARAAMAFSGRLELAQPVVTVTW
jgi:hypothetical protein